MGVVVQNQYSISYKRVKKEVFGLKTHNKQVSNQCGQIGGLYEKEN